MEWKYFMYVSVKIPVGEKRNGAITNHFAKKWTTTLVPSLPIHERNGGHYLVVEARSSNMV